MPCKKEIFLEENEWAQPSIIYNQKYQKSDKYSYL